MVGTCWYVVCKILQELPGNFTKPSYQPLFFSLQFGMSVHDSFFFTSRKTLQVHLRHIRAIISHRQPQARPANMCTLLCLPPPPCIATFMAWQLSSWPSGRYRTAPRGYSWPICQVGHDPTALAVLYYRASQLTHAHLIE